MKYLIFGTGDYYERYKRWFRKDDIGALLDNSVSKQGTVIDGIRVMPPEEGIGLPFDCIVILSFYVKEMKRQLVELGVSEDRIYHFYDLHKLIETNAVSWPIQYFGNAKEVIESGMDNKILLLSQDMTLGGPAIALLHAAEILMKQGYIVVYASMLDGPLRKKIQDDGIPIVIDGRLQIGTMKEIEWIDNFHILLCSTINFHIFLSDRDAGIPVIWWLHDSLFFYDGIDRELLQSIDETNLHTVSVGAVPEKAIRRFLPSLTVGRLLYGVEDTCRERKMYRRPHKQLVFVIIGYIEARKGQDILIQAIEELPDAMLQKAVFYLIGQDSSMMAQEIKSRIQNIPEVIITGKLGRAEIDDILNKADMLICPSREDPMPTVAAEAMMHSVPCMLSDVTGTAEYIHHREDGILFPSEDVHTLAKEIEWCIEHRDSLADMGERARKIYETIFSMEAFEASLTEHIGIVNGKNKDGGHI